MEKLTGGVINYYEYYGATHPPILPDVATGYLLIMGSGREDQPSTKVNLISTSDKSGISEDLSYFTNQLVTVEGEYKIIEGQTFFNVYKVTTIQVSPDEIAPGGFPAEPTDEITAGETITTAKTAGFSIWGIFLLLGAILFIFSEKKKK